MMIKSNEQGRINFQVSAISSKCLLDDTNHQQSSHINKIKNDYKRKFWNTFLPSVTQKNNKHTCYFGKNHVGGLKLHEAWSHDQHARKKTHKIHAHGTVPMIDQKQMIFQVYTAYGTRITCRLHEQYLETIINAFNGYKNNTKIRIQGNVHTQNDHVVLESANQLNHLDVPARLDEFRNMRDGWLDGDGHAPSHVGLNWLSKTFQRFYPHTAPLPHTYPTYEGGIRMEWSHKNNKCILETNLQKHESDYLFFDRLSDDEFERKLNLDSSDHWQWLINEIQNKIA